MHRPGSRRLAIVLAIPVAAALAASCLSEGRHSGPVGAATGHGVYNGYYQGDMSMAGEAEGEWGDADELLVLEEARSDAPSLRKSRSRGLGGKNAAGPAAPPPPSGPAPAPAG
ncbi:MAG: hypothetical protein HY722_08735, partial [Planctomycetes bacterium]|nr:hypothetical protein [Planctomycetota bacterium]